MQGKVKIVAKPKKEKAPAKHLEENQVRPDFLTRFQVKGPVPMAERPLCVRLPADVDELVRAIPNRTDWLRDAILEKLEREYFQDGLPS